MKTTFCMTLVCGWVWLGCPEPACQVVLAQAAPGAIAKTNAPFEHLNDIPHKGAGMPITMVHDAADRPYLYVAANEGGLLIFDVKAAPRLVHSIPASKLASLNPMSLSQVGNRLHLALGNHWDKRGVAALAVIEVEKPAEATVAGTWKDAEPDGAGGAVVVDGKIAYLAAMGSGLVVLDVGNPSAIRAVARLQPPLDFPDARPDRRKINARGLALRKNLLYLCYDAGGVRVIDIADPKKPTEIGRYSNPAMTGRPRAYNNIALNGSLAYVTADYVGLEILDISNPRAPKLVSWWNPWNPKLQPLRWFDSPGHANEIAYDAGSKMVLMSAGRSDLVAIDVSDPAKPRQAAQIGDVKDTQATWGLSIHGDLVYLSYIRTLGVPFLADWPGIKVFRYRR